MRPAYAVPEMSAGTAKRVEPPHALAVGAHGAAQRVAQRPPQQLDAAIGTM